MNLCCEEVCANSALSESTSRGAFDEKILNDERVLEQLLENEERYIPMPSICSNKSTQSEITAEMRKVLSFWMLEVSEELKCEEIVFPLAINYVDRFLSVTNIRKSQLQLLGAVCLLIASKLRQCKAIHPHSLVYYSDYSLTVEEIIGWELLVLSKLEWDISAVVAIDFVDHLLLRLPSIASLTNSDEKLLRTIKKHTFTFIALCSTELHFSSHAPSLIATACIATAISGLNWPEKPWSTLLQLLAILEQITGIDSKAIHCVVQKIEELLCVAYNATSLIKLITETYNPNLIECSPLVKNYTDVKLFLTCFVE